MSLRYNLAWINCIVAIMKGLITQNPLCKYRRVSSSASYIALVVVFLLQFSKMPEKKIWNGKFKVFYWRQCDIVFRQTRNQGLCRLFLISGLGVVYVS